ncbi:MAG: replication initiation protein [Burkholderiaceae bacterium]|nr:replication initiation protein [Burkholderiaceae bacterium]
MRSNDIVGPDRIDKPVSALAMVPKTGTITRVGRQAYTLMMFVAREQGAEDGASGMFGAPLNSVIRGYDGSTGSVKELKKHLLSMVTHVVEWQSPSPGETEEWGACGLLSQVSLKKKNGENWLYWAYPPALRQEMLYPLRYAQIRRSTIAQFRSHAGLALYEICARYKDNPSHLTSKQHWHWWLPVLTGKPAPEEIKTEFRFFNRDTIKPAIEEVNEVSELTVAVHEFKVGRSIEFLQFEVRIKQEAASKEIKAIDMSKVARAIQLGIDAEIAEDLFIRHGELAFAKGIERLEARLGMPGTPILSRHAYLKTLLSGKAIDKPVPTEYQPDFVETPVVRKPDPGLQAQANLRKIESEKLAIVRKELEDLEPAAMSQLLSELKQDFLQRKVSHAVMKRLEEGRLESALIMGELARFYWKRTRGTEWSSPDALTKVERVEQAGLF